jgi:phosphatidylglycerophosphatase A
VASGTAGSLIGLAIYAVPGFENTWLLSCAIVVVFLVGIRVSGVMERAFGHDPAQVTIDEIVGMWISLLALPKSIAVAAGAFLLFRVFDIIKPYPARRFDRMTGGVGIMMDDVVAGVYANVILRLLLWTGVFSVGAF